MLRTAFVLLLLVHSPEIAFALPKRPPAVWLLRGQVIPAASVERGHYEVGLYSVLGANGLPVGYPLVQEILPSGRNRFQLRVPVSLTRAYLFAEFVEEGTGRRSWIVPTANPWNAATPQPAELYLRVSAQPRNEVVASGPMEASISGTVGTLFAASPIPQADVLVRVRGRKESARTDSLGSFTLRLPSFQGRIFLEFLKDGYLPAIVPVSSSDQGPMHADIASRYALDQISQRLGLAQGAALSAVFGQALTERGTPLRGLSVRLSRPAEGPFYFDDRGVPTRDLRSTSGDGRFLFLNVQPGPAFLESEIDGEIVAPVRVSTIDGELLQKTLTPVVGAVHGRLFNAVKRGGPEPVSGARVRIEGTSDWTTTDSLGVFNLGPFKWIRGETVSLMFSASQFQNHRYQVLPGPTSQPFYAFPARYLERLAQTMGESADPAEGVVVGRASGPSIRIDALADQASANGTRDFYFDANGRMRAAPAMTDPRFGTYLLLNVPNGHVHLLGSDADGRLRYGKDIFAGSSVVNVEVDGAR